MRFISNRRVIAAIVATSCLAVTATASADQLPSSYKSDAAQSGSDAGTPYSPAGFKGGDSAQNQRTTAATFPPAEFRGGDTPVDHPGASRAATFPPAAFRGGDTPVDHPGASRAATVAPTTIEVVRPERTIVRDVDEALPLILSSTALLLVLAGLGVVLIRTRIAPRPGH